MVHSIDNKKIIEISGRENKSAVVLDHEKLLYENQIGSEYVSTRIAASILGISPNALRIRKCRGEIECKYFGKELRFNVSYLKSLFCLKRKNNLKGVSNGN